MSGGGRGRAPRIPSKTLLFWDAVKETQLALQVARRGDTLCQPAIPKLPTALVAGSTAHRGCIHGTSTAHLGMVTPSSQSDPCLRSNDQEPVTEQAQGSPTWIPTEHTRMHASTTGPHFPHSPVQTELFLFPFQTPAHLLCLGFTASTIWQPPPPVLQRHPNHSSSILLNPRLVPCHHTHSYPGKRPSFFTMQLHPDLQGQGPGPLSTKPVLTTATHPSP